MVISTPCTLKYSKIQYLENISGVKAELWFESSVKW